MSLHLNRFDIEIGKAQQIGPFHIAINHDMDPENPWEAWDCMTPMLSYYQSLTTNDSGDVLSVWQDLRDGTNRIRFAQTSGSSLEPGASVIVDDATAATHLYGPQVTTSGGRVLVAWEDPRSGYARVRLSASD